MDYSMIMAEANQAALEASENWVDAWLTARGKTRADFSSNTMMDLCGNSWLDMHDRRTVDYKTMKKLGFVEDGWDHGGKVLVARYPLRSRQDAGIHEAAMRAAKAVFDSYGISTSVRSYID